MRRFVQSFLLPTTVLSVVNVAYTMLVVVILQSWLLTWHLDRKFPFSMIPLWAFCLVSIAAGVVSLFYLTKAKDELRLGYDKLNVFLIYVTMGLFVWIIIAIMLIHTYYIGDFNVWAVLRVILLAKVPLPFVAVPAGSVDVFPTLGDSLFLAYFLLFILLYLVSWRGLRAPSAIQTVAT